MSGHNKWSGIKHRKEAQDSKRAKVFTKIANNIVVAVQKGGGDPIMNPSLKIVMDQARAANMPKENVERAIKRGLGEGGERVEEVIYEAFGPGNIGILIVCVTDNTNRSVTDVKTALKKNNGKFVPAGSVSFQFLHRGRLIITTNDPDAAELAAIDAGASDVERDEGVVIVYTVREDFYKVRQILEDRGFSLEDARMIYYPTQTITVSDHESDAYERLYEALDALDDVQEIYDNRA